jgi:succinyl-CoA synthetase beta subunit/citryl-CoA synthetase large subunit
MRLIEYEAKALLKGFNIPVPAGRLHRSGEGVKIDKPSVLKAQIPVGGRGKSGGIAFVSSSEQASQELSRLLSSSLRGYPVDSILIEDQVSVQKELFLAVTYDTDKKAPVVIFSSEGGIDIEELATQFPEKILSEPFSIRGGFLDFHARNLALRGGLQGKELLRVSDVLVKIVGLFLQCDATLAEINPLILTPNGEVYACDAHIDIEDEALYRQTKRLENFGIQTRETGDPSEFEKEAIRIDSLDHRGVAGRMIEFDGSLGLIIGGGGASLTTFDAVRKSGGRPANYCEVGGNPSVLKVKELTKLILSKPGVEKIAVIMNVVSNTRVDLVARGVIKGIIESGKDPGQTITVFRIPGAWEQDGFQILKKYNVDFCDRSVSIDEAARRAAARV